MRESPGAEDHRAAPERGRRRLVPRPPRAGAPRPRPRRRVPLDPKAYDGVVIVTDALVDRLRAAGRGREPGRRPAQRDRAAARARRSGSCEGRRRRARLLGPEPRAQLRRARRPRLDLRGRRRAPRRLRDQYPDADHTSSYEEMLADDVARCGRDLDPGPDPLRARQAGAPGGQARPRREAAGDARRRDGRARRASPASATSC